MAFPTVADLVGFLIPVVCVSAPRSTVFLKRMSPHRYLTPQANFSIRYPFNRSCNPFTGKSFHFDTEDTGPAYTQVHELRARKLSAEPDRGSETCCSHLKANLMLYCSATL